MAEEQARQTKQVGNAEKTTGASRPVCFVIMPISDASGYESGHFSRVYEYLLKPSIEAAGFEAVRADDEIKTDYIVTGIIKKIVESEMILCDISTKNPNVLYELGIRHAFGKPVAIIKDKETEKIFDIQGLRYHEYNESLRIDTVKNDVEKIKEIILKTYKGKEDDFNSVVSLAMIQSASVPHKKELNKDLQFVLNAISALESKIMPEVKADKQSTYVYPGASVTIGNETFKLGAHVFDKDFKQIGVVGEIIIPKKILVIKGNDGKCMALSFDNVLREGIGTVPF
jgi:hypothetical protein